MDKTLDDPDPQVLIKDHTIHEVKNCDTFFKLIPDDWKECLLPYWDEHRKTTRIYGIYESECLIGGGLIFSKPAPDTEHYAALANSLFKQGYLYIGFLWINPDQRGRGLGTSWLDSVKESLPKNRFWLAIEDEELANFYLNNGFVLKQKIHHEDGFSEWIFVENRP